MARLVMFAQARQAAGTARFDAPGAPTVGAVIAAAIGAFGDDFARVVPHCKVWRNGEPAEADETVTDTDEVALLPPVSGGATELPPASKNVR